MQPVNKIRLLLFFTILNFLPELSNSQKVTWFSTTTNERWKQNNAPKIENYSRKPLDNLIEFFPDERLQEWKGFGVNINELGRKAFLLINESKRGQLIRDLFDTTYGCRFSFLHFPIGSDAFSDFQYSLNDNNGNFNMDGLNLNRDKKYIIPFLKTALNLNKSVKFIGTVWSSPSWLKYNNGFSCILNPACSVCRQKEIEYFSLNQLIAEPQYYTAFANYNTTLIKEYSNAGIPVSYLNIGSFPDTCTSYPGLLWSHEKYTHFIKDYLALSFYQQQITTKICTGIFTIKQYEKYTGSLYESLPQLFTSLGGVLPENLNVPHDFGYFELETQSGENTWEESFATFGNISRAIKKRASFYIYRSLILSEDALNAYGQKNNSLITVYNQSKEAYYNPDFYLIKHLSHFLKGESHIIKYQDNEGLTVAFQLHNGKTVIFVLNPLKRQKQVKIKWDKKMLELILDAESFNTLVIG